MSRERRPKPAAPRPPSRIARPVLVALFLSGVAGLMHQVVWAKLLVGFIGATAHAQAAVLGVFMGGLALGAVVLGRYVDAHPRPLRLYAILEAGIGVYCLGLPLLLWAVGRVYLAIASAAFESAGSMLLLRVGLATLTVLLPAVLMGGTLPILARTVVGRVEDTGRRVANLYALNSFGALIGAGLAGFATLPAFGVYPSLVLASLLNLAAGALVMRRADRAAPAAAESRHAPAPPSYTPSQYAVTLAALALSGFAAMGYEVLFTRLIALAFGSSTYSFTIMLMAFITGIAFGSAMVARLTIRRPLLVLAVSQLAVALTLLAMTPLVSRLPYFSGVIRIGLTDLPYGFELDLLAKAGLCLLILFIPTTCLGFSFPLVAQVQARSPREIGTRVGAAYAWNTAGNVLGVIVTTLLLIPDLGTLAAFHFNVALTAGAGLAILAVTTELAVGQRAGLAAATLAGALLYAWIGTGWIDPIRYAIRHLRMRSGPDPAWDAAARARHPAASFQAWQNYFVVKPDGPGNFLFAEDAHTSVLVFRDAGDVWLAVNGKPDASAHGDLDTQLLLAHAPLFLAPDARSVLVIGYGSGITTGSVLRHPVERVDVVEISRGVLAADALFAEYNDHALADPRVRVYEDDGMSFLRAVPRTFDVIISEPSNPWVAGVGNLFTVEFFETVRDRLAPGGVFTCWFHTYEQSDDNVSMIIRTLAAVFPHTTVFSDNDFGNAIAVASMTPLTPDFAAMEARYATVGDDLARLKLPNLAAFLSHQRLSPARFQRLVTPGVFNTIDHPRLEFAAPWSMFHLKHSYQLDGLDPLVQGEPKADILLDDYIAWRAANRRPLDRTDLEAVATYALGIGGYGEQVAESVLERADAAPERADTGS